MLSKMGFKGDLRWIYNEEGSGARYYKSSVYYPDSRKNPRTNSGVTIDPGLDLGNADIKLIEEVIGQYVSGGLLSLNLALKMRTAFGRKKQDAIDWINKYELLYKNIFLVPEITATYVLDKYSAPVYWKPLINAVPELLTLSEKIAPAIHTALLSQAYNRGCQRVIKLSKNHIADGTFLHLALEIKELNKSSKSLNARRNREADLIVSALNQKENFVISFIDVNPLPLTSIPVEAKELITEMEYV